MKIALPTSQGKLCAHFGHCEEFTMFDVDFEQKVILRKEILKSPPHEPGKLPVWLKEKGVTTVIAGGMGVRAQQIFNSEGVSVIVGASESEPENIVRDYLNKKLKTGENVCDH
jgi:predicted Fe-Mo cluster-binding NifX family protein